MSLRHATLRFYHRCAKVIVPNLRHSQDIYEDTLREQVTGSVSWLDIGCGHQVLPEWRLESEQELVARAHRVVGLDRDFDSLRHHVTIADRVFGDVGSLPFADESFTLVTANMVVEHLEHPETEFAEIGRVLGPGGLFVFHTPNYEGYIARLASIVPDRLKLRLIRVLEGRLANDVFPTFYRANTVDAIQRIAQSCGLEVVRLRLILTTAQFSIVPGLAALELLWIRALMSSKRRRLRTNLIAILRKPSGADCTSNPTRV